MAADGGTWDVTANVERYDEAVDHFLKRTVISAADAKLLDDSLKHAAFWVAGGLNTSQVQTVFDKMAKAIEAGTPYAEWRKAVKAELTSDVLAETVFRNAAQTAYNNGRFRQMMEPGVLRFRPIGLVDAVLDGRTTVYCRECNGIILPLEDVWWDTHWFPAHHRCRTSVRNLRRSEAAKREQKLPAADLNPAKGWGLSPRAQKPWMPKPEKHDPVLIKQLKAKAPKATKTRQVVDKNHKDATWKPTYKKYGEAASTVANGRASLERGLDMPIAELRKQLKRVGEMPGVKNMVASLKGLDGKATLRESAGELDAHSKAAAAVGGHLERLAKRAAVTHPELGKDKVGARAMRFYSEMTAPTVVHPGADWTFFNVSKGGACVGDRKAVWYTRRPGVLEHEWAHALEHLNPEMSARAVAFLRSRTVNEGREFFHSNGWCWRDGFFHYYAGRDYRDRTTQAVYGTEITSTAMEVIAAGLMDSETLVELIRTDLDHFLFALGQLAHK